MIITNYSPKSQTYFKKPLQNQSSKINFKGGATSVATAPLSTGKVGLILGAGALLFAAIIFIAKKLSIKSKQSTEQKETQKEIKQQLENQSISSASNKKIAMEETKKSIQKLKDETISINDKIEITKQFFKAQGFSNEQIEKALKKAGTTDEEKVANICKWLNEWLNEWLTDEEKQKNNNKETGVSEVRSSSSGPSMSVSSSPISSSSGSSGSGSSSGSSSSGGTSSGGSSSSGSSSIISSSSGSSGSGSSSSSSSSIISPRSSSSPVPLSSSSTPVSPSGSSEEITDKILKPNHSFYVISDTLGPKFNSFTIQYTENIDKTRESVLEVVKRSIALTGKTVDTTAATSSTLARETVDTTAPTSRGVFTVGIDDYWGQETFVDLKNDETLKTFVSDFWNEYNEDIEDLTTNMSDTTVAKFANDIHKFVRDWNNQNPSGPTIGSTDGYQTPLNRWRPDDTEASSCYPLGLMVANPQLPVCRHRAMLVHAIVLYVLQNKTDLQGRIGTGHVTTGGHEYNVLVAQNDEGETFNYKIDALSKDLPQKATWKSGADVERFSASELLEFKKTYLPAPLS